MVTVLPSPVHLAPVDVGHAASTAFICAACNTRVFDRISIGSLGPAMNDHCTSFTLETPN